MKIRFLPIFIFVLTLTLVTKLYSTFEKIDNTAKTKKTILTNTVFVQEALAQEHQENAQGSHAKEAKAEESTAANADTDPGKEGKKSEPEQADAHGSAAGADGHGEKKPEEVTPAGLKKNDNPVNKTKTTNLDDKEDEATSFSRDELRLLKNLSKRRKELEEDEEKYKLKVKLLEATELRVDNKVAELNQLKTKIEELLKEYNSHEDMKINSLVKIYENMKPKEAAQIFEQLDMSVLLRVINRMKETKVSPILAKVNPEKAKEISTVFANQQRIVEDDKATNGVGN